VETGVICTFTSSITQTSDLKQADDARQFEQALNLIQTRLSTFGKSKIEGKTLAQGVHELGIVGYAKEKRIDELRKQIRELVLHDLGITKKQYDSLRGGIKALKANPYLSQGKIDKLNKMSDDLDDEITKEVERRLQEHLAAEAQAGEFITNTIVYDKGSQKYNAELAKLTDMLAKVIERYAFLKRLGDAGEKEGEGLSDPTKVK
jgi:hypothetical protein